ncbi:MAG: ATP-binding protein [Thermodesulfobacteriota bacterium]|nr:ATP-binding protein [Thermodesulfobacteriota bacterium]
MNNDPKVPHLIKNYKIKARDFIRAGDASIQLKSALKTIGFDPDIIQRASICAYEAEMNVVMYGSNGSLSLSVEGEEIFIEVRDDGPGIENIELAIKEGYSTATEEFREMGFGAGMGLPNIKEKSDSFEINSQKDKGTYLKIGFLVNKDDE